MLTVSLVSGSDSVVLVLLVLGYSPGWVFKTSSHSGAQAGFELPIYPRLASVLLCGPEWPLTCLTGSTPGSSVAQASLESPIPLSSPSECWGDSCVSLYPAVLCSCVEFWVTHVCVGACESGGVLCEHVRVRTCFPMSLFPAEPLGCSVSSVSRGRRTPRTSHSSVGPTGPACVPRDLPPAHACPGLLPPPPGDPSFPVPREWWGVTSLTLAPPALHPHEQHAAAPGAAGEDV